MPRRNTKIKGRAAVATRRTTSQQKRVKTTRRTASALNRQSKKRVKVSRQRGGVHNLPSDTSAYVSQYLDQEDFEKMAATSKGVNTSLKAELKRRSEVVKKLACGANHTAIILTVGETVWVTGKNDFGQLGLQNNVNQNLLQRIPDISDVDDVACGEQHTAVLKQNGSVWLVGGNDFGQLGIKRSGNVNTLHKATKNNVVTKNNVPVQNVVTVQHAKAVACGSYHTAVVSQTDGKVLVAGYNRGGELGIGRSATDYYFDTIIEDPTSNQDPTSNPARAVACGLDFTAVLKDDGTLWVVGQNTMGQLGIGTGDHVCTELMKVTVMGTDNEAVACGTYHMAVLKKNGDVWVAGNNVFGQLGKPLEPPGIQRMLALAVEDMNMKAIACGESHTAMLTADGDVWVTGRNNFGQLGIGNTDNQHSPVKMDGINKVEAIACGDNHTAMLKDDGTVWVTGYNEYGQLGLGHNNDVNTPQQMTISTQAPAEEVARKRMRLY